MPIRPIRGILTRAHERAARQASERASERAENRSGSRSGTAENKRAEVGVDSRIDVDTLAYQSHSPNGHRRVKSLHLLPLSGLANREGSRSPSIGSRPVARKKSRRGRVPDPGIKGCPLPYEDGEKKRRGVATEEHLVAGIRAI